MRLLLSSLVAATTLAMPALAHAATMDSFVLTGNGNTVLFSLPASPAPSVVDAGNDFAVSGISFVENGTTYGGQDVYFYNLSSSGGFDLEQNGNLTNGLSFIGSQLYTGSEAMPTFLTGTFSLSDGTNSYKLVISPVTATPEPGTLGLLGTGVLGAAGAMRRRVSRS